MSHIKSHTNGSSCYSIMVTITVAAISTSIPLSNFKFTKMFSNEH